MAAQTAGKDSASLSDFLQILRLRKALVALLVALVLLTTLGITALLPKWYLSTAKIRVEKPEGEMKLFQSQSNAYYDPYFQQDQFRILQSEKILYPVIESLGLGAKLGAELGAGAPLPPAESCRYLLRNMLNIDSQRSSSIIDINVYARDPALAAAIANEIARVYSEDRISLATSEQRSGLGKLRGELEAQERIVSAQRDAVEKLRKDMNISGVDLNSRYSDMEIETLRQMQNSLIALRVDAIGRKTRWERFRAIAVEDRIGLVNSELIQDSNIQNLLQAYLVADQNVARLKARLGEAHPELIAAVDSRAKMKEQLDSQLRGYQSALEISYNEAEARVTELESQLAKAKVDQILSARERLRPFEEAIQKLDDETRLLTTLKLTLRQREIDFQVPKKTIEILNVAEPARYSSKPNWAINIAAALFFGLLLGVGSALALDYFDTSFRSVADVEAKLQLPALGVIPLSQDPASVALDDMAESEPYRVLHTNLNMALPTGRSHALMMCSAGPGEGKSTTLHHVARLMAAAGARVILIDSDLRRPVQHRLFGCGRGPGLGEYLRGEAELERAIQANALPGLAFMPAGSAADFTLGLLQLGRLKSLIDELRTRYDWILFDSPPIIGVSDASVLATAMDGIVLLIQHRRNPQSMVMRARQIIDGLKVPIVGVVLNQVPSGAGEDYAYYTGNYAYYGEKRKRRSRKRIQARDTPEKERLDLIEPEEPREKDKNSY
ncbi:MAG: polysaccharide biosynthesis tyrosine autokinase [Opitutaceae bacterium]|jgi:capsular exopolysaccharide synthesis family protein